jgi:hypothetical protein
LPSFWLFTALARSPVFAFSLFDQVLQIRRYV